IAGSRMIKSSTVLLLAGRLSARAHVVPKNECAPIGRSDDIGGAIVVQVDRGQMRTNSGAVMDQFRDELRPALRLRIAHRPVPIQHRGTVGIGVGVALQVGPLALAYDEIGYAVSIEIRKRSAMRLREGDVSGVPGRKIAHDLVLDEPDIARVVALLL